MVVPAAAAGDANDDLAWGLGDTASEAWAAIVACGDDGDDDGSDAGAGARTRTSLPRTLDSSTRKRRGRASREATSTGPVCACPWAARFETAPVVRNTRPERDKKSVDKSIK